ncbi:MAG: DUF2232 domain-containing protein [Gammaproteobacteria bacterium]|nr:DUF2232 domain-containing protein [Gammaproteobacteria bacterium]
MRAIANYTLRGRMQATLVIALAALLSFTGILAPLSLISGAALALVVLRHGTMQGLTVVAISALIIGLMSVVLFNDLRVLWVVVLSYWVPVLILAELLRRTVSLSVTVSVAAALALGYVALVYLVTGDPAPGWVAQLTPIMQIVMGEPTLQTQDVQALIQTLSKVMTGTQAASELAYTIFALFIARWWQAILFNEGGFRKEFHAFRLAHWLNWPALLILLAMTLSMYNEGGLLGQMAVELGIVILALYVLQGVAVVHGVVGLTQSRSMWLVAMYVLMILPQVVMLVGMVGIVDSWLNFRARFAQANG